MDIRKLVYICGLAGLMAAGLAGCREAPTSLPAPTEALALRPAASATAAPAPTRLPSPTARRTTGPVPTADCDDLRRLWEPTATATTTPVPAGIFAVLFYPPLVLEHDPAGWEDGSQYGDRSQMKNYLQALEFESCVLGVSGPSGFYPPDMEIVQLGPLRYSRYINESADEPMAVYFADQGLPGYDFSQGIPVFSVSSRPGEWADCQAAAGEVLGTLRIGE